MLTSFLKKLTGGKFLFLIATVCLSVSSNVNAQEIEWQNTIGGSGIDDLRCIQQTNDGGFIIGGLSDSHISGDKTEDSNGGFDFWIIKTDSSGNMQWQNTIGGSSGDWLYSFQQTNDGGYILGGNSFSNISGDKTENCIGGSDYWIVKIDSAGNILWQNTIGGSDSEYLFSIQQSVDGGYILGGHSLSNISGDKTENSNGKLDFWIVKTDSTGNIQWQNSIGGSDDDGFTSIDPTTDGGFIIGGWSMSNISGDKTENCIGSCDYWMIKTDAAGNIQWQNTIGGNNLDWLNSIQQTADGGYILGGWSFSNISGDKTENNNGFWDLWVVKTDSLGNIQWQNTIGGSQGDELYSIRQTVDSGYILGARSNSNITGDKTENCIGYLDYWIVKTDSVGNIHWQNTIGGTDEDWLNSIQQTSDEGYILGGWSKSNTSGDKTENSNGGKDYWIVKICDSLSATRSCSTVSVSELEVGNSLFAIYPNPSKDVVIISAYNLEKGKTQVKVFDVFGKSVLRKQITSANCQLPIANFSKGVYFIEVTSGNEVYRTRLVKE